MLLKVRWQEKGGWNGARVEMGWVDESDLGRGWFQLLPQNPYLLLGPNPVEWVHEDLH